MEPTNVMPQIDTKEDKKNKKSSKSWLVFLIVGLLGIFGGVACFLFILLAPKEEIAELSFPTIPSKEKSVRYYSNLTGLEVESEADITAPAYCIQTPNGTDGGRPQSGLNEAGVIFEAIAEAGITRFAAIYQNPKTAVIGPIRSLRIYYLQWDTPFDCTIVHAGGAPDALAAVSGGGYKDLTENYAYMYRGTNSARRWNNLFTTSQNLARFSADSGYTTSNIKGFNRMTPEESERARIDANVTQKLVITEPTVNDTSELAAKVTNININFGGWATFNLNYQYNPQTNTYDRWYATGDEGSIYKCADEDLGERDPEAVCTLTQMSPAVVVGMVVQEKKQSDNYHEDITTVGSGDAYIFQNGNVIKGSWMKSSVEEQIKFFNEAGDEVKLAPGQTVIEAVPAYGGIEY